MASTKTAYGHSEMRKARSAHRNTLCTAWEFPHLKVRSRSEAPSHCRVPQEQVRRFQEEPAADRAILNLRSNCREEFQFRFRPEDCSWPRNSGVPVRAVAETPEEISLST